MKGETTIDDNFNVNQNVVLNEIGGTTLIKGATTFNGPSLLNSLEVQNGVTLNNLGGTTTVKGATTIANSLEVDGITNINNDFNVTNSKATNLSGTLTVDGISTLKGQTTFDINVSGDQTAKASYPVLIKGSKQGLAIELTPVGNNSTQSHRGNNYISFWRGSKQRGRIEGMGQADINPQGLCDLFVEMINSPPAPLSGSGLTYDPFSVGMTDNIGSLLNLSPGGLPSFIQDLALSTLLSPGSLPDFTQALGLSTLLSPGGLPSLNSGALPFISISGGSFTGCTTPLVCDPITGPSFPSISLNPGGLPTLVAGTLPSISNFDLNTILNKGTLPSLPNFNLNTIFEVGQLPSLAFPSIKDFVNFSDPFTSGALTNNPYCTFIDSPSGKSNSSPSNPLWNSIKSSLLSSEIYPASPNFNEQIYSDYTLDVLTQGISATAAVVKLTTSVASVSDPEDVFAAALDLVVEVTNLTIFGTYSELNLGVAFESGAGDYAEWLLRANSEEVISKGDIVGVIGGKVSKQFSNADQFMVVSTAPLLLGNMPENITEQQLSEKIAFMGQVPVKIQGNAKIGDYILPSGAGDGLGIAVAPSDMLARDYQRIVGIAWENGDPTKFINLINTAVGVNQNDMAKVVEQMQFTLNHIQDAIKKIDPSFVSHDYEVSQEMYQEMPLDYNVSSTHQKKMSKYFKGKNYADKEELIRDVKDLLVNQAGIDLNTVPVIKYIFDNPEEAGNLAKYYNNIFEDMVNAKNMIQHSNGE